MSIRCSHLYPEEVLVLASNFSNNFLHVRVHIRLEEEVAEVRYEDKCEEANNDVQMGAVRQE